MFIHVEQLDTINTLKLSCDINNTKYTIGLDTSVVYYGEPDIKYTSIIFVKSHQIIWTHGEYYKCFNSIDVDDIASSIMVDNVNYYVKDNTIDLGYINKKVVSSTSSQMTLLPNTYNINTNTSLSSLTITLGEISNDDIINEFFVEFTVSNGGTTISLPNSIKWQNGEFPVFEPNATYQISIVNNLGICTKFK